MFRKYNIRMKITIISDNYVDTACMIAEHGFCCLAETAGRRILFDTGQGDAVMNNMRVMGITGRFDMLVLSHGHYDHTGGLVRHYGELAEYVSDIYASRYIFDKHLKKIGDTFSFIGFDIKQPDFEGELNLHLNDGLTEIADGVYLSGRIERFENFDADGLLYAAVDGEYGRDMFRDEQYMAVREADGLHIITGCTHCGAVNLLRDVRTKFPSDRIISVTGGLHLFRSDDWQVDHVIDFLKKEDVQYINTGHCTGLDAAIRMKQALGDRLRITKAGLVIQL
jgi:7,8-dihydropterin-6-yl-methyl-4-(beta-D-ribofuranosyl)aminobenzene 5'-phosphate synthase